MKVLAVQNLNTSLEKIKQKVSTIQEQITNLQNSISVFTDTEDVMKGKLGNSIRSFLLNVHQPFLFYLQQSLTDYEKAISNIEKLVSAYESDENGLIREEFVANALTNKLNKTFMETESVVSNINDIIQSISDLIYSSPLDLSNVSFKVDYGKLKLTRHIEELYDIDVSALGKLGSVQSDLATMKSYLNNLDSKSRMGSLSVTNFNLSAVQGLTDYQTMKSSIYKKVVGLNGETIADMSLNDISTANDLLLLGVTPDVRLLLNHAYASLKENKLTEKVYLSVINYLKVSNAQRKHDDEQGSLSSVTGANIKFLPNDSEEDRQLKEYLIKVKNGEVSDTNSLVNVCLPDSDDYGEITIADKKELTDGLNLTGGGFGTKESEKAIIMGVTNFLILDDINTIRSKDETIFNKSVAATSLVPVGKILKVAKLSKFSTVKKKPKHNLTKKQLATKPKHSPDPNNWVRKGGNVEVNDKGTWTYTNKKGQSVSYPDGYPDFSKYMHPTVKPVKIKIKNPENRSADNTSANREAGLDKNSNPAVPRSDSPPKGYTWHHHEDGKTMILVERGIHRKFTHRGGISNIK